MNINFIVKSCAHILLLLVIVPCLYGQPPVKIEHYSTEQGLSHDLISSIFKDKQGYLWLGTYNGLNRFDGNHFTSYNSAASSVSNQRIDQILEDDFNQLWLKSYNGQVHRFDKATEKFLPLSSIINVNKMPYVNRILSVSNGMLWLGTVSNGIIAVPNYNAKKSSYYTFSKLNGRDRYLPSDTINFFFNNGKKDFYVGTPKGLVRLSKLHQGGFRSTVLAIGEFTGNDFSAVAKIQDTLYFGTAGGRLITFNDNKGTFETVALSKGRLNGILPSKNGKDLYVTSSLGELFTFDKRQKTYRKEQYSDGALFSIFEDKGGNLWLQPEKRGVVRWDVTTRQFRTFWQKNDAATIPPRNHFRVFEDRNGTVWSVLRDGGFGYYDPIEAKFQYFYNEPGSMQRRFSNLVVSVFYDSSGVMFLHTDQRGLDKVIFNPNDFKVQLAVNPGLFKSENEMRGLLCDRMNRVWAGARSGLLYVYHNEKKVDISFEGESIRQIGAIYTMFQSSDGNVWLGTKEKGLFLAQPINAAETTYRLSNFKHDPKDVTSLSSNQIYSICEDKARRIWVGTFDKGLNLITGNLNRPLFKKCSESGFGYPSGFQEIRHMAVDDRGRLWIGSTEGLVIGEFVSESRFKFYTYAHKHANINSLGGNDIQFILKDHLGRMWLATSGGGLNLASAGSTLNSISFRIFSTFNGLGSDYVLSCMEDNEHQLWIATKNSLTRFNLSKGRFDNFNSYDGVPNDGFSEASAIRTKDGKLVFGTIRGLLTFDPQKVKYHPIRTNMVFTNLQVNNKDVNVGHQLLDRNIDNTNKIVLEHDQNIISIDYAALDFRSADRQNYQYRLVGFDHAWQNNKNRRRASYTNLPPGSYVFEVKSPDSDNYINVPSKSLKIKILPPFWKTWWAYLIYLFLFAIALEITRRLVSTFLQLRQDIAIEQKMASLKMNFFTNVSHELRTPLTLILNPIEEILKKAELSAQVKDYATIVQKNAKRMVHFVNQLLDLRKSQSGQSKLLLSTVNINSFIRGVASYFVAEAEANHIKFDVYCDIDTLVNLDAEKVETAVYNLLSNAFKFSSPEQKITLSAYTDQITGHSIINVTDQGCGVPENDLEYIFQLYHESRDATASHPKGTGIGLALAKELIELHGGKISASNILPHGLSVTIQLPQLQEAPANDQNPIYKSSEEAVESTVVENVSNAIQPQQVSAKPLVLLVEDNVDMRSFLTSILTDNYRVETASDGKEGLLISQKIQPDVVVSDIMMPVMDGIELLDRLKNDHATSHIPVILLSAKSALEGQIVGLRYGADYYISKPFNNELLFAAIAGILQQRKRLMERIMAGQKVIELGPGQVVVTSKDEVFLQKVIAIVEEKMVDPDFDIDTVAKLVNMGRTTFFLKFKSLTQQAPVEFVRDMRLKMAKQYLDGGAGNIAEISYSVGFGNPRYFSTCFKAAYGMSPTDYVKSIKS